jgi:hypothetical protein
MVLNTKVLQANLDHIFYFQVVSALGYQTRLTGNGPLAEVVDAIKSSVANADESEGIHCNATRVLCSK